MGIALAVLTGCGATGSAPAQPATATSPPTTAKSPRTAKAAPAAKHLQHVTLRMPWIVLGYDAPFLLAKAKGYYKAAGFDVSILQGKGSATAAETVASGADTFGLPDASVAALFVSRGEPLKVVATFLQQMPDAFASHVPINTPRDLIGKTIITSSGDADLQMLPAVLATAGMTKKQVKIVLVDPSAIPATFMKNRNYVGLGFTYGTALLMKRLDPKAYITPYRKFGLKGYSIGLVTSLNELRQHPKGVLRFVAASIKGWKAALADPAAALAVTLKAFPHAKRSFIEHGMKVAFQSLHTKATEGHPIGWMAASDWKATLDLLHKYAGMKVVKPLQDYYTNVYLPQS